MMYKPAVQQEANLAEEYFARCEEKLQSLNSKSTPKMIPIKDPANLSDWECEAILQQVARFNFALYECELDKVSLRGLGKQLGLVRLDHNHCADKESISSLRVNEQGSQRFYIPYSNRPLSWHTDGYYNPPEHIIRSFILHCVSPAQSGGENSIMDPDLVYYELWRMHPKYVFALFHQLAMTIPENIEAGKMIRASQSGPVFHFYAGRLHMRYSARKTNIHWRQDKHTLGAVAALEDILKSSGHAHTLRLGANQGIISNNVLHNRTGFVDGKQKRLYYRARYYDAMGEG